MCKLFFDRFQLPSILLAMSPKMWVDYPLETLQFAMSRNFSVEQTLGETHTDGQCLQIQRNSGKFRVHLFATSQYWCVFLQVLHVNLNTHNRKNLHRNRFRSIAIVQYQKVAMAHAIVTVIVQLMVDVNRALWTNYICDLLNYGDYMN